jgi:hypothetical protein
MVTISMLMRSRMASRWVDHTVMEDGAVITSGRRERRTRRAKYRCACGKGGAGTYRASAARTVRGAEQVAGRRSIRAYLFGAGPGF